MRNTTSRQLGQKVPYYKYLNSGAVPKWVETAEEVYDTIDRIQDICTERGFGSSDVPVTNSISESSTQQPASLPPTLVVSSPIEDQDLSSSFGVVKLPEGPLLRSPVPLGWSYSDPSTDNSGLGRTYLLPDSLSPLHTPDREELSVTTRNPSAGASQSAPSSPVARRSKSGFLSRRRSPFLGNTALEPGSRQSSGLSLDWDNYVSSPTFYRRHGQIPVVSTPSTSLESTPSRTYEVSPEENPQVPPNTPDTVQVASSPLLPVIEVNMDTVANMEGEARALQVEMHDIENMMRMFPPEHMTADRLQVYNEELKEIKDKFRGFSTQLLTFCLKYSSITQVPRSLQGHPMTIEWWQNLEQTLAVKVGNHHLRIRQAASELQVNRAGLSDFERRDLEIKEKQLALMEENNKKSAQAEKVNANAVAQSRYDEILTISIELDDYLNIVTDWEKATRAEVITAMKSQDKWAQRYNDLHKAHRAFSVATSTYLLSEETEKVEDIMQEMIEKYSEVTKAIQEEDKKRELYSLVGDSTEQVKMPRFSGVAGEDFTTFKSKLMLALEKNRVAAADKIDKLRSCLSGQALALVPEKTKDFNAALNIQPSDSLCPSVGVGLVYLGPVVMD